MGGVLNPGSDMIRFVMVSGDAETMMEQEFQYVEGHQEYQTAQNPKGRSEFVIIAEDEILLNRGGFESPTRFIKPDNSDFVILDSNTRRLSAEEIQALDDHDRWIAKNEIYARHGYPFQNEELRQYFSGCRWYRRGEFSPEEFRESGFSDIERDNLELFVEFE